MLFSGCLDVAPKNPEDFSLESRFLPIEIEDLFCIGPLLPASEDRTSLLEEGFNPMAGNESKVSLKEGFSVKFKNREELVSTRRIVAESLESSFQVVKSFVFWTFWYCKFEIEI